MDVNDTQENGPHEEPTTPLGPRRLTRSRTDRIFGGVAGGLGRYFNVDPLFFRIGAIALAFVGGAGLLLYLAALLLVPNEDAAANEPAGTEGRNRGLAIAGVVVLLIFAFPFLVGGGFLLAGIGIPIALLVGAGVLVWWLVSGEGPSGDAGDILRRAALGVGILILCGIVAILGAFGAAAGPDWLMPVVIVARGRRDPRRRLRQAGALAGAARRRARPGGRDRVRSRHRPRRRHRPPRVPARVARSTCATATSWAWAS